MVSPQRNNAFLQLLRGMPGLDLSGAATGTGAAGSTASGTATFVILLRPLTTGAALPWPSSCGRCRNAPPAASGVMRLCGPWGQDALPLLPGAGGFGGGGGGGGTASSRPTGAATAAAAAGISQLAMKNALQVCEGGGVQVWTWYELCGPSRWQPCASLLVSDYRLPYPPRVYCCPPLPRVYNTPPNLYTFLNSPPVHSSLPPSPYPCPSLPPSAAVHRCPEAADDGPAGCTPGGAMSTLV